MIKLDGDYSDYTSKDEDYPEGKAINATTSESYDGTPLLAEFMNDINGAHIAMYEKAYGSRNGIDGKPDTQKKSQFADAVEKLIDDTVGEHDKKRGLADGVHGATNLASPGQIVTRDDKGNAKFGTPLENDDAARRGDIYEYTKAVVCETEAIVLEKKIPAEKYPGLVVQDNVIMHVIFKNGAEVAKSSYTSSLAVSLDVDGKGGKKIFVQKKDSYVALKAYNLNDKYRFFQPNTEFDLIYNSGLDAGNGAWIIVNNPIVLHSGTDSDGYAIYADGRFVYSVDQLNNSLSAVAKSGKYSDLLEKPDFLPASGIAEGAYRVYAQSHPGEWYLRQDWDGNFFQTQQASGNSRLPVKVAAAGNADTVAGRSVSESAAGGSVVLRTEAGYVNAVYFNSSNGVEDDLEVKNIFYDTGDGYHRKVSLNKFKELIMQEVVVRNEKGNNVDLRSVIALPEISNT